MPALTLGERGQVVIPKAARNLFGYAPGDQLLVLGDEGQGGLAIMKAEAFWDSIGQLEKAAQAH